MNIKWTTALIVGALIAGVHAAAAKTLPESRKQAIDAFVGQFVDFAMFDGTILVDIAGQTVYEQSFGFAQVEQNVRHDANTRFRLASVSKTLTDAAIAKMIENGVFALDTPIARFLPDFPSADIITIAHLIEHTSGIPHTNTLPWGDGTLSLTIDEIVDRLAKLPLTFEPGTDARYSNGGFTVLAKILEIAGNGTLSEVMRATVFEPLGMHDTDHITDARTPIPNMATGYEPGLFPGQRRHTRFYAVEIRPGGGSFYSTKGDMLRFAQGVFRDDFVPADAPLPASPRVSRSPCRRSWTHRPATGSGPRCDRNSSGRASRAARTGWQFCPCLWNPHAHAAVVRWREPGGTFAYSRNPHPC